MFMKKEPGKVFYWQNEDVFKLIEMRTRLDAKFTGKKGSAIPAWQEIAENLNNGANWKICRKRWDNLQRRYKEIVTSKHDDNGELPSTWPFFNILHEYFSSREIAYPQSLYESPEVRYECLSSEATSLDNTPTTPPGEAQIPPSSCVAYDDTPHRAKRTRTTEYALPSFICKQEPHERTYADENDRASDPHTDAINNLARTIEGVTKALEAATEVGRQLLEAMNKNSSSSQS